MKGSMLQMILLFGLVLTAGAWPAEARAEGDCEWLYDAIVKYHRAGVTPTKLIGQFQRECRDWRPYSVTQFRGDQSSQATTRSSARARNAGGSTGSTGSASGSSRNRSSRACYRHVPAAAKLHSLPGALLDALIDVESAGQPKVVSSANAAGCTQLIKATARAMGVTNRFDAEQNVRGGAKFLRLLLDRYDQQIQYALAAYNIGPGVVDPRYEKDNFCSLPFKNRNYVFRILKRWKGESFAERKTTCS